MLSIAGDKRSILKISFDGVGVGSGGGRRGVWKREIEKYSVLLVEKSFLCLVMVELGF